jgi:hypothetical protein
VAAVSSPGPRPAYDRVMAQTSMLPGVIARLLQLWLRPSKPLPPRKSALWSAGAGTSRHRGTGKHLATQDTGGSLREPPSMPGTSVLDSYPSGRKRRLAHAESILALAACLSAALHPCTRATLVQRFIAESAACDVPIKSSYCCTLHLQPAQPGRRVTIIARVAIWSPATGKWLPSAATSRLADEGHWHAFRGRAFW